MRVYSVLKLDSAFRPVGFISWFDYVLLYLRGKATVVEAMPDEFYTSPSTSVPKALVIQVHHYVKLKEAKGSKSAVKGILYLRDKGECQYCGKALSLKASTKDHVIPKSRGESLGMTRQEINSYENQVLACRKCNHKKADKLPWEARMYPRTTPKIPAYVPIVIRGVKHPVQKQYVDAWYKTGPDPNDPAQRYQ